jgi:hypothetical protein
MIILIPIVGAKARKESYGAGCLKLEAPVKEEKRRKNLRHENPE